MRISSKIKSIWILLTAVTTATGLSIQFYYTVGRKLAEGFSLFYAIVHYFSYFTIIINTLVTVLLLSFYFKPNSKLTVWFKKSQVNSGIASYIVIVGAVYYALLFNPDKAFSAEVVASHLLHTVTPISYLLLWYFDFRAGRLNYIQAVKWLILPLLYFSYLLIRGLIVSKYPYFFIDVVKYGYGQVILNAFGVMIFFLIMGITLIAIDRRFQRTK